LATAVCILAGRAEAEPEPSTEAAPSFGSSGQLALSVDRLAGVSVDVVRTTGTGIDGADAEFGSCSSTGVNASFFGSGVGPGGPCDSNGFGAFRWGADVFVAQGLSLGGAMSFTSNSQERGARYPSRGASSDNDTVVIRSVTLSPRVGYAHALGSRWAIWPRIGVDWTDAKFELDQRVVAPDGAQGEIQRTTSWHLLDAAVDVKFVFSPISHVALFGGPFVRLPLSMGIDHEFNGSSSEYRIKAYEVGAAAGVLLYL
jgi:hypothetical protein